MKILLLLLLLPALALSADRVVLLEDFTNYLCGPCWTFEPTLNAFIASHPNDLAVIRPHVWWPGNNDPIYTQNNYEQWHRVQLYNVNSVPWIEFDGVIKASSSGSGLNSAFNTRMAVPCYLEIQVTNGTIGGSGTLNIRLIAEQNLGGDDIFANAVLVENGVPGAGYWNNSVFEQAFRDELFGPVGESISFGPNYPDTVDVVASYDTGDFVFENLQLAVFVQNHGSVKEVYNAWFDYLGAVTGIEDDETGTSGNVIQLDIYPNPSSGYFSVNVADLGEPSGTVSVYDLTGRCIESGTIADNASSEFMMNLPGVYFVKVASGSDVAVERVVVLD